MIKKVQNLVMTDSQRLFRTGVPHLFIAMLFTQGMGLIRRICLARFLSVPELGQLTYVMQIADLLVMIADFGMCTAVLKFAAEPVSNKEKSRLYSAGLFWSAVFSSIVALFYMAIALFTGNSESGTVKVFMLLVAPYIPFSALAKVPLTYMQACKQIKRASAYTIITRLLSFSIIIAATYCYGLWGFFITVTAMPISNLIILLFATRRDILKPDISKILLKKLSSFGFISMLANTVGFANGAITVILLRNITKSDDLVGYYSIALVVMNGLRLVPTAFLGVAFPYLSDLLYKKQQLKKRVIELSVKQLMLMLIFSLGWLFSGKLLIALVFGEKYLASFNVSVILMFSLIPFSVNATVGQTLLVLGKVKYNFLFSVVQLIANASFCWILISKYGSIGAAQATLFSQIVFAICSISMLMFLLKADSVHEQN